VVRLAGLREQRELGKQATDMTIALPASVAGCATASVGLLDEYGNELWPAVASAEVCRPTQTEPATPPAITSARASAGSSSDRPPARRLSRAAWTTGAVTGALVVATGVLGWGALERRAAYHDSLDSTATFGEQQRLMEDASTAQTRATVGAIAAGVMAAATLVLYLVERR
jgi:hypothetical protein